MGHWANTGFVAQTVDEYKTQIEAAFVNAYGDDFSLDETTPQGILITALAEMLYNTDMDGVEAFSRLNINSGSGVFLDLIGGWRGIPRSQGTPQTATVHIKCDPTNFTQFTIPAGVVFQSISTTDSFKTDTGWNISATEMNISLVYTDSGDSALSVGNKLSVEGYSQITDIEVISLVAGQGRESDLDYRRRLQTEYPVAQGTIEYVQNKIYETGLVDDIGSNYNDTASQVGSLPAYTTEWMAIPKEGADEDVFKNRVAEAIINNKVPGSPTYGNTTVTTVDVFGNTKTVNFTIPDKIELEIYVQVTTPEGTGILDLSNKTNIQTEIAEYINGLRIGKDVSYSRCMYPLAADKGFDVAVFKIREKDENAQDSDWVINGNFTIGEREYARINPTDIRIGI